MTAADLAKAVDERARRSGAAWLARCPAHADRTASLSIRDGHQGVLLTCFGGCDRADIIAELRARGLWVAREHMAPRRAAKPRQAPPPTAAPVTTPLADVLALWGAAEPIAPGSIAAAYLAARGCTLPPADGDLRWSPRERHPCGHTGPALVALVTDAVTGEPLTCHRTWVRQDGTKAELEKPRLLMAGRPKAGGMVRLWGDDEVILGLAIAEGLETALAAARGFTPIWSTLDAGNLANFPALDGIEALTVFADHDRAGLKAWDQVAERWTAAGREVRRVLVEPGADFADWMTA